jgi:ATP-dependent Clp protease ATP-binding subunit ClpC
VSFKNTLIVMTSNVGSTSISKGRRSMGFMTEDTESSSYVAMKSLVMEELKAFFRPELLNRIDEMVVFRPLEKTQVSFLLLALNFLKKSYICLVNLYNNNSVSQLL